MEYNVKIDAFEGPLDLLLHLIKRFEIDIYDIPIAQITKQYLSFIHTMQELELDIASEYLVMAATLLAIKSKMLLPNTTEIIDEQLEPYDEMENDPREELMQRLLEYRKYKNAALQLKELEKERSQLFSKPPENIKKYMPDDKNTVASDVSIYDMLQALQKLMKRKKWKAPLLTKVHRQEVPIQERMTQIIRELEEADGKKNFYSLFTSYEKSYIVVTFLAILELIKNREVRCEQERNFADIFIYRIKGVTVHGAR